VRAIPIGLVLALVVACTGGRTTRDLTDAGDASSWLDRSPHRSADAVLDGVRLNHLDWGGSGPPLVLIHGIGDSPHAFDELAPHLGGFRVVAYARRGHGHSDAPPDGPYDLGTLVDDLRRLLDALGIARASFVGWSMGGNEITAFAARHPERVEKLVYLESGYDWSDAAFLREFGAALEALAPDAAALASLDAYRAWYRATWLDDGPWTPGLEAYLRDTLRIGAGGRVHPLPNERVFAALFASLAAPPRDYARVQAPALALYAPVFFPRDPTSRARADRARAFERRFAPFRRASIARIKRELRGVQVKTIPGTTHMSIGFRKPELLAATIRAFLVPPPPAKEK
jgi:pimeloyl-ACP methyl ester carboxylesterase